MAFANPNISDIIATTIEARSRKIADNVTKNNALLSKLSSAGRIKTVSGGSKIIEEISFAENANVGWYSGYDTLPTAPSDVVSGAEYSLAQAAVPVVISGMEMLQNSGKEALLDLMEERLSVAESSIKNLVCTGLYSDGTAAAGKQIKGLAAAFPTNPATGSFGNIDRNTYTFWRHLVKTGVVLTAGATNTVQPDLTSIYSQLVRGTDAPDLIIMDGLFWSSYVGTLQQLVRFSGTESANMGFPSVKFMQADCILDGGIGGGAPSKTAYVLNSKYLKFRPHKDRNFVPLSPNKRYAINQDAEVQILAFAGAFTVNGMQYHAKVVGA